MAAGLQGDIQGGVLQQGFVPDGMEGAHLGVRPPERACKPFAYDAVPMGDHGTDHGVWRSGPQAVPGDLKAAQKVFFMYIHPVKIAFRK